MQAKKTKRGYDASRRRASADERRGRILQTARNLFGHYGYGATSIERIAGEAGVAVPTVYAMYRSKRAMLFALLDQEDAQADVAGLLRTCTLLREIHASNCAGWFPLRAASTRRRGTLSTSHEAPAVRTKTFWPCGRKERIGDSAAKNLWQMRGIVLEHFAKTSTRRRRWIFSGP